WPPLASAASNLRVAPDCPCITHPMFAAIFLRTSRASDKFINTPWTPLDRKSCVPDRQPVHRGETFPIVHPKSLVNLSAHGERNPAKVAQFVMSKRPSVCLTPHMELIIRPDKDAAALLVARIVASEVRANPRAVLGLATGST